MTKVQLATTWLDGCSGCHMSFLDLDERLLELAERVEIVYSPLVDVKDIPSQIDVCLVEGAVSSEEDLRKITVLRERSETLVSVGDCAITTNVPGMRNTLGPEAILTRAYVENATLGATIPGSESSNSVLPRLLAQVVPVHHVVRVDRFLPGCPPPADAIWQLLCEVLAGAPPTYPALSRFGK